MLARHIYAGVDVGEEIPSGMLFKFQKCYDLLHSSEKWKHHIDTKNDAKKTMAGGLVKYKRSEMEFGDSSEESDERPLGGKKAKRALKKQKKSMDVREKIVESQLEMIKIEKRKAAALEFSGMNEARALELQIMMQDGGPGSKERRVF
jgi:hypothetical protein